MCLYTQRALQKDHWSISLSSIMVVICMHYCIWWLSMVIWSCKDNLGHFDDKDTPSESESESMIPICSTKCRTLSDMALYYHQSVKFDWYHTHLSCEIHRCNVVVTHLTAAGFNSRSSVYTKLCNVKCVYVLEALNMKGRTEALICCDTVKVSHKETATFIW